MILIFSTCPGRWMRTKVISTSKDLQYTCPHSTIEREVLVISLFFFLCLLFSKRRNCNRSSHEQFPESVLEGSLFTPCSFLQPGSSQSNWGPSGRAMLSKIMDQERKKLLPGAFGATTQPWIAYLQTSSHLRKNTFQFGFKKKEIIII